MSKVKPNSCFKISGLLFLHVRLLNLELWGSLTLVQQLKDVRTGLSAVMQPLLCSHKVTA